MKIVDGVKTTTTSHVMGPLSLPSDERAMTPESVESDAKDRAAAVVIGWRGLDWAAAERGEERAVLALQLAAATHESARRFLLDEAGAVGARLVTGLDKFYSQDVVPHLRPSLLARLATLPAAEAAGGEDDSTLAPRARPTVTLGHTVRMNTGCGNLYVTINETEDGQPFELFNHMGKAGGCAASQNEAIGRLISYSLRCGASVEPLIKQLKGISCHRPAWGEDGKISSCSDAIGKALEKYWAAKAAREGRAALGGHGSDASSEARGPRVQVDPQNLERLSETGAETVSESDRRQQLVDALRSSNGAQRKSADHTAVQGACHDCGSQLSYEEGCVKCHSCGFTECG
ncbi:MAG: TSCPD domain-containing protein [Planctomycetota bacterium]